MRKAAGPGAIGLINSRTAQTPSATMAAAAHLTIGAGARLPAGSTAGWAYDATDEGPEGPASRLYAAVTGTPPPVEGVVVLGINSLRQAAAAPDQSPGLGFLGDALRREGLTAAVIGNADAWDERSGFGPRRHGALIAMDRDGYVPSGNVGRDTLTYDEQWPFGRRTDYDELWNAFVDVYDEADFIVVELGDFARLDAVSELVDPARYARLTQDAIRRTDEWIGRLVSWPPAFGATVVFVSPSPPAAAARAGRWLTPVLWTTASENGNEEGPGLVTSKTTRRVGIAANTDLAPLFLSVLKGGPGLAAAAVGRLGRDLPPGAAVPGDPWEATTLLYRRAVAVHGLRPTVIQTFIVSAIVLFLAGAGGATFVKLGRRTVLPRRIGALWKACMLLLCAAPGAMLLLPLFPSALDSGGQAAATLAALTAGGALAAHVAAKAVFAAEDATTGGPVGPFVLLCLATATALVADAWTGSRLMKSSVLGFDPIVGARYYGIGNEYMGVLIGTALVGTTGWLDLRRGKNSPAADWPPAGRRRFDADARRLGAVVFFYAVVAGTLAAPDAGANVGGTAAAAVACLVTASLLFNRKLSVKTILQAAAGAALLLTLAAAFDGWRGEEAASHLGRTVHLVLREGPGALLTIAARKMAMNIKLLRWTIWAQVFLVCLALSAVALLRPSPGLAALESRYPRLLHGIRGTVVGALVALVANDSGIVAAATAMIPVTATFMHGVFPVGFDADTKGNALP